MGIFSRFTKKKEVEKEEPEPKIDFDYEIAEHDNRLFFRNEDFTIEVKNVKFTMPPNNWQDKEFAILTFTYDIFEGGEYIKSLGEQEFELLVGGWIRTELSPKN